MVLLAVARSNVITPKERKTPLHLIVEGQGDPKNVDVLLGSNADVLARDCQGLTARQRLQVILADKPRPDNERTSQWRTTCELLSVVENLDRRNSDLDDILMENASFADILVSTDELRRMIVSAKRNGAATAEEIVSSVTTELLDLFQFMNPS